MSLYWWLEVAFSLVVACAISLIFSTATMSSSSSTAPSSIKKQPLSGFAEHSLLYVSLQRKLTKIPSEVIAYIFQFIDTSVTTSRESNVFVAVSAQEAPFMYLKLKVPSRPPLSHKEKPTFMPVKVMVSVTSRDQGWSSYPAEQGHRTSHTWGELSLERHHDDGRVTSLIDDNIQIYKNIHAGNNWETHTHELDLASPLVQALRRAIISRHDGDLCLAVNLLARYPGWQNRAKRARLEVTWSLEGFEALTLK